MKKLLVIIILICLSACIHEKPIEKAKKVVIHYVDSIGRKDLIKVIRHNFYQDSEYKYRCEYSEIRGKNFFLWSVYFNLDSNLSKVISYSQISH